MKSVILSGDAPLDELTCKDPRAYYASCVLVLLNIYRRTDLLTVEILVSSKSISPADLVPLDLETREELYLPLRCEVVHNLMREDRTSGLIAAVSWNYYM
jgi:hypothetical protein